MSTFAERLSHLFETVHPRGRGPHSLQEVAAAVNAEGVVTLSASYLSQLRSGQKTNPAANTVAALARFFKVSSEYFLNDEFADRMDRDLETLVKLRDAGVRSIVDRSFDLSPDSRDTVASLIESLRRAEGLPIADKTRSGDEGGAAD